MRQPLDGLRAVALESPFVRGPIQKIPDMGKQGLRAKQPQGFDGPADETLRIS